MYLLLFSPTLEQNLIFAYCCWQQRNTQPSCGVAADELVELQLSVTNRWWSECDVTESSCTRLYLRITISPETSYESADFGSVQVCILPACSVAVLGDHHNYEASHFILIPVCL